MKHENKFEKVNFKRLLKPMVKNAVQFTHDENFKGVVPVGRSKIGGKPDLPPGFEWFYYFNKGELQNRHLGCLAQINCAEARKYDNESLLPPKGMLYFFCEMEIMKWGGEPEDKGCARVWYYPGDLKNLTRTDFPADLPDEHKIPETPISFFAKNELPDFDEFLEWNDLFGIDIDVDLDEEYGEAKEKIVGEEKCGEDAWGLSKLLGYANLVQGTKLLECEAAALGIEILSYKISKDSLLGVDIELKVSEEELALHKKNSAKWQLLFQLGSIKINDCELYWGDVGKIYFYIRKDDLAKLNFDNCVFFCDCY